MCVDSCRHICSKGRQQQQQGTGSRSSSNEQRVSRMCVGCFSFRSLDPPQTALCDKQFQIWAKPSETFCDPTPKPPTPTDSGCPAICGHSLFFYGPALHNTVCISFCNPALPHPFYPQHTQTHCFWNWRLAWF